MFKKIKINKEKRLDKSVSDYFDEDKNDNDKNIKCENNLNQKEQEDKNAKSEDIQKIKLEIDDRLKKPKQKGYAISRNSDLKGETNLRDDNKLHSVKKVFLAETLIENAKSPEELKKLLGTNREEIEKIQLEKRRKLIEFQKDLYTLPENLNVVKENYDDHVDNIVKLSAAGLIEVPITLEQKLKNIEDTEFLKRKIMDNKLEEELDYLKVLKKLGPSYARGYKNDLSHKTMTQLNNVFENVFVNPNSRKRKFMKEKMISDNRNMEKDVEDYVKRGGTTN